MTKLFQEDIALMHDVKTLWNHADKSVKSQILRTAITGFGLYIAAFAGSIFLIF